MIVSKLTSKAQTTIPQPVRAALGLEPGDEVVYEIVDERVPVDDMALAGLPVPSLVRTAKVATIQSGDATRLGRLTASRKKLALSHLIDRLSQAGD